MRLQRKKANERRKQIVRMFDQDCRYTDYPNDWQPSYDDVNQIPGYSDPRRRILSGHHDENNINIGGENNYNNNVMMEQDDSEVDGDTIVRQGGGRHENEHNNEVGIGIIDPSASSMIIGGGGRRYQKHAPCEEYGNGGDSISHHASPCWDEDEDEQQRVVVISDRLHQKEENTTRVIKNFPPKERTRRYPTTTTTISSSREDNHIDDRSRSNFFERPEVKMPDFLLQLKRSADIKYQNEKPQKNIVVETKEHLAQPIIIPSSSRTRRRRAATCSFLGNRFLSQTLASNTTARVFDGGEHKNSQPNIICDTHEDTRGGYGRCNTPYDYSTDPNIIPR